VLGITSDPDPVPVGGTSDLTASLVFNSSGADTSAAGFVPDGIEVAFAANAVSGQFGGAASVTPADALTVNGEALSVFSAPGVSTIAVVSAEVDNQTVESLIQITN